MASFEFLSISKGFLSYSHAHIHIKKIIQWGFVGVRFLFGGGGVLGKSSIPLLVHYKCAVCDTLLQDTSIRMHPVVPANRQFPQLSIMIIYNSTWSILIQWIRVMIFRWQSDIVKTKESTLSGCDKPYHTNKRKVQKRDKIEVLMNCALTFLLSLHNLHVVSILY